MSPAVVHALRHRPILTKGGPVHLYVFVPGKDRAKALCREATDAIVAKIDGAEVVTRLARCKGSHDLPQGYSRQVRVPDKRVVGGMHAAASVLLRRGWCVEVERDADVAPDGVARKFVIGTAWRTVVACEDPSHVRRVVAAGHAPCVRCEVESLYPVPVADETSRVESLVSEAVCSWLPLVLLGTPAAERHVGRNVFVEDARDLGDALVALRESLAGLGLDEDTEAYRATHEAAHACYALATCEFANEGRNRLLAEAIRRALVVGAGAKKLHGERYRVAVREARAMGVL